MIFSSAFLFSSARIANSSTFVLWLCWVIIANLDFCFSSSSYFWIALSSSSCFCFSWSSLSLSSDFISLIDTISIELLISVFGATIVYKLIISWISLCFRSISSSSSCLIYYYLKSSCSFISSRILSSLSFSSLILSYSSNFYLCFIYSSS